MNELGDGVRRTVGSAQDLGRGSLARRVVGRFRGADGTSHARALAYQVVFVVMSGFIGLVGLASVLDVEALRSTVVEMSKQLAPGPSSRLLEEAARQGSSGGSTAMLLGLGSALVAGMFAMAQLERSGNRIAGVREDRPGIGRYLVALGLSLSAGVLIVLGLVALGAGSAIATGAGWTGGAETAWSVLRWPIGFGLSALGVMLLFRAAPRVRIASTRSLAIAAVASVALWVLFTLALSWYFAASEGTAQTYGSLLAVVALVLWAGATSVAVHLGLATAVELDDGRAARDPVVSIPEARATADASADDGARTRR